MNRADLEIIDQPATSLNLLTDKAVERDAFLNALLDRFFSGYGRYMRGGFAIIKSTYVQKTSILGKQVVVAAADGSHVGTARDFDPDGGLVLENEGQGEITLHAGEVQWVREDRDEG
jgi:biotin-(acetyl-CoA carboxylase) ligase